MAWLALHILQSKLPVISRVIISKQLLANFRKQVITAYPNETMSTLWGRAEGDTIIISALRTPDQKASVDELSYHIGDAVGVQANIRGESYLGTIHSHPECSDATPSQHDWDTSFNSGERVFAVMRCTKSTAGRFKTEVRFWEPRPEIAIINPRVRSTGIRSSGTNVQSVDEEIHTAKDNIPSAQVMSINDIVTKLHMTGVTYNAARDSKPQVKSEAVQKLQEVSGTPTP